MKHDNYYAQLLRANGDAAAIDKIIQDKCRRQAAKKLATTLSLASSFRFPTELSAEQCTSDEVAEFHASLLPDGCRIVDLTAGLGIDDFHFARTAERVLALELDPAVAAALEPNATALGIDNLTALCCDSAEWLRSCSSHFDVAFIDPARRAADGSRLYALSQCRPNVIELLADIERVAPRLLIKASPMLDVTGVLGELRDVAAIYSVGTRSECKELLIDIRFGHVGRAKVFAVTVGEPIIECLPSEPVYAQELNIGDVVGEPWPAVMKLRPSGLMALEQLHPSTHLFRNPPESFPGDRYKIERIEDFSSSTLRRLAREGVEASVAARNFPLGADQLRKRIKARENSGYRLLATTLAPSRQLLLFMTKIL